MKKDFVLLIMTVCIFGLISCGDQIIEDPLSKGQTVEEAMEQLEVAKKTSPHNPENTPASARPDDDTSSTCYTAYLEIDKDCDGTYEISDVYETATWGCCSEKIGELIADAMEEGWCYNYDPALQCASYPCAGVPACQPEF